MKGLTYMFTCFVHKVNSTIGLFYLNSACELDLKLALNLGSSDYCILCSILQFKFSYVRFVPAWILG